MVRNIIFLNVFIFCSALCQTLSVSPLYTLDGDNDSLEFNHPKGLSIDSNGYLYVSDTDNHRILKIDQQGQLIAEVGGIGWSKDQFQHPMGLYVYNTMNLFVADHDNHRIVRFDKDLNWIMELSPESHWDYMTFFSFPLDIFVSFHGDYFVVDGEDRGIVKLDSEFSPLVTFGGYDWGEGSLSRPVSIHISLDDLVLVSDNKLSRIFVFDYYGNFLYSFGDGFLKRPRGVFADSNNLVYVVDQYFNKIYIFDIQGRLLYQFGHKGSKLGAFNSPCDLVVHNNKLFVLESLNNRIQVFSIVVSR